MKAAPSEELPQSALTRASSSVPLAVELTNINKSFDGVRVLTDLSLSVRRGTIHALLGGNGSGKSTTLKTLAGIYTADAGGSIAINGRAHGTQSWTPAAAYAAGLRFVHQDLGLVDELTVAENYGLANGFPRTALKGIAWGALRRHTAAALDGLGVEVGPDQAVGSLRPSEKTMVAVARSIGSLEPDVSGTIVLDEPTASLPHSEVELLLTALKACVQLGQTIIYVSHRLPEVFSIADRASVLRDGVLVADEPIDRINERAVISIMAGDAADVRPSAPARVRDADASINLLTIRQLSAGPLRSLDLDVSTGEIVGVAGLTGSGRSSLLRAIFGHMAPRSGSITMQGRDLAATSPTDAMARGIAFVPEDRKRDSLFSDQPVWDNVSTAVLERYWRRGRFQRARERSDSYRLMRQFHVKARSPDVPIRSLSGGNQQKAIMARWLRRDPRLLLLDEPSQGVDAAARAEIHDIIREHVDAGNAALVVSSDFAELVALCDRVVVLRDGCIDTTLAGADLTEANVSYSTQFDARGNHHDEA